LREEAMECWLNMLELKALWFMRGEPTGEKPEKVCW
jgi:hypothetical protein